LEVTHTTKPKRKPEPKLCSNENASAMCCTLNLHRKKAKKQKNPIRNKAQLPLTRREKSNSVTSKEAGGDSNGTRRRRRRRRLMGVVLMVTIEAQQTKPLSLLFLTLAY
jgi:hypothetical protein